MKNFWIIAIALAGLALFLVSCTGGGGVGEEQSAGPFKVTLSTSPNPPAAGRTDLTVKVSKDGAPAQDAAVKIDSSMPGMNMPGPSMDLQPSGDAFIGTLNMMAGEWEVKVNISNGSDEGSATFTFDVE